MSFSRRGFLQSLGAGAAASAIPAAFPAFSPSFGFEPVRPKSQDGFIRLNSNENPYGPSPKVKEKLVEALAQANRYPVSADELTRKIADAHRVTPDRVLIGCGSTELIRVLAAAHAGPGKSIITASPTYEEVGHCAKDYGAEHIALPLDHEYGHDLEAMLSRIDSSTALVYICNPNNPTASITPRRSIEQFLSKVPPSVVVVIDEAYHHFVVRSAMYTSFLDDPVADERLVILRTFSKVFGLAGMRIGYAVASPKMVTKLSPHVTDFGISEVALQGALAAMDDDQGLRLAIRRNADDRQEFFNQAQARMLKPIDSKTNFMMMDVHHPATEVIEHFRKNNILIGRVFPPMNNHIRISFGTPANMEEYWRVWDLLPFSHGMKM
jgi:histidinol-phosphate aminotransferase